MAKSVLADLLQIFQKSVSAVLPENLIRSNVKYNSANQQLLIAGENYNIQNKDVYLVGAGKAVQNMAREIQNILNTKIKSGVISIPEGSLQCDNKIDNVLYYEGARNNLPDKNAEDASRMIKGLCSDLNANSLLLVLISGGGSALLPLPKEPITLKEKTELIKKLASAGADITELNTVRKRLSDLKGGQLAIEAQPASVVSLILSDIVGDPLDLIGSGPTVENKDDPSKAVNIIKKYKLFTDLPKSIVTILEKSADAKRFPKDNVVNYLIGTNKLSINAAVNAARNLNYFPIALSDVVTGEIKHVAKEYSKLVKIFSNFIKNNIDENDLEKELFSVNIPGLKIINLKDLSCIKNKDLCLILGGEITVEVKGTGKGGRNQQLALEFSNYIYTLKEELTNFEIFLLSAGTDGIDGPTDAAGAIGYLNLIADANTENINVNKYLENNDSYNFYRDFRKGDLHVFTGHTNTNVMDIHLILIRLKK